MGLAPSQVGRRRPDFEAACVSGTESSPTPRDACRPPLSNGYMSAVCVLAPVVIVAWPAFSAAVIAAATSLGYEMASEKSLQKAELEEVKPESVRLEIENSEVVTNQLGRDQRILVSREGVTITFSRDARGRASLCVTGEGYDTETLRTMGEELSQAVVQQYVYQKIMDEMRSRGFTVVEETTTEDRSIRLKVRHWEN